MKIIVTGASGVLGTAVYDAFKTSGHEILGLAHSRSKDDLVKLDLLDNAAVEKTFGDFKPDCMLCITISCSTKVLMSFSARGHPLCSRTTARRRGEGEKLAIHSAHTDAHAQALMPLIHLKDPAGAQKVLLFIFEFAGATD